MKYADPVLLHAVDVRDEEDHEAHREGRVQVVGRGREAGDEADRVRDEDDERAGADERQEELRRLPPHHVRHRVVHVADEELDEGRAVEVGAGDDRGLHVAGARLGREAEAEQDDERQEEREHVPEPDRRVAEPGQATELVREGLEEVLEEQRQPGFAVRHVSGSPCCEGRARRGARKR